LYKINKVPYQRSHLLGISHVCLPQGALMFTPNGAFVVDPFRV